MKTLSAFTLNFFLVMAVVAQMPLAITIDPPGATAYDELTLTFDPAEACVFDSTLAGLDSIAIHSGVTYMYGPQWQNVINFDATGINGQATTLWPTGDGRYSITYTPYEFYGFPLGMIITEICAVFNNGTDWSNDGRDFDQLGECIDFFIPLNYSEADTILIPGDYATIQAGIDAANNGNVVLVDDGTYYENINFKGKSITVASNFLVDGDTNHINNTIIDGSQSNNPNMGSVATFMNGEDTTSVLNGFTITGGNGIEIASKRMGGGIVCFQSGAKIVNNKILNNEVTHSDRAIGGGICSYFDVGEAWIVVENNIIDSNICNATNVSAYGGGIYSGSKARIINNIISNNGCNCELADADGGGVEIENLYGVVDTVYIINNTIRANFVTAAEFAKGGGIASIYPYNFILNNTINDNILTGAKTVGGGIWLYQSAGIVLNGNIISENIVNRIDQYWGIGTMISEPLGVSIITDNEFFNNTGELTPVGAGGGLAINGALTKLVYIQNNRITHNEAYHGAGFYEKNSYHVILINNLFEGNKSYRGGAIGMFHPTITSNTSDFKNKDYRPQIINNTFTINTANNDAGAIRLQCELNAPEIYNCIFYENESPLGNDIYNWRDDTAIVSFSNINTNGIIGNWEGEENIDYYPMFVNSGNDPYQINDYSPCIDAGTPDTNGLNLPEFDLAGEVRFFNERVDIGAYEWNTYVGIGEFRVSGLDSGVSIYPNPFTNSTTIAYEFQQPSTVQITIYNHLGKQIEVIQQKRSAGKQQVIWNAEGLPSGVYFCVLKTESETQTTKMIKMK